VQKAVVVVSCCSHTPWQAGEEGARSKFVDVGILLICELDGNFRSAEVGMHGPVGGSSKASTVCHPHVVAVDANDFQAVEN